MGETLRVRAYCSTRISSQGLDCCYAFGCRAHNVYIALCVFDVRVLHMLVETCMSDTKLFRGPTRETLPRVSAISLLDKV